MSYCAVVRGCLSVAVSLVLLARAPNAESQVLQAEAGQAAHGVEQVKPWLGVGIEAGAKGVLVNAVIPGTPAASAGLQKGDEITAVDATTVKDPRELIAAVQAQGVGNTVQVHLLRSGKAVVQAIKLVARPDELEVLRKQLVGKPMPAFKLAAVSGKDSGSSADLHGKVAIIEFWATWCPACRSTHSRLSQFARDNRDKGLVVLGISDEDAPTIEAYSKALHPSFTLLSDPTHTAHASWLVTAIPELAVVDQSGQVVFATVGAGDYLEEALQVASGLLKPSRKG